ncbi:MAG: hypothetical protein E6Q91_05530, partial [Actinobacteria bacterium]
MSPRPARGTPRQQGRGWRTDAWSQSASRRVPGAFPQTTPCCGSSAAPVTGFEAPNPQPRGTQQCKVILRIPDTVAEPPPSTVRGDWRRQKGGVVRIGVPRESKPGERRVAATPKTVEQLE